MNKTPTSTPVRAALSAFFILISLGVSHPASAWERGETETFALLPSTSSNPEAITHDTDGNLYVSTLGSGEIHQYDRRGKLLSSIVVSPSSGLLLDLGFHPDTGELLVIDFGARQVLRVDPLSGQSMLFSAIPGDNAIPNVITFDRQGYVYVSDSAQGTIWRIAAMGGPAQAWLRHPLLTTHNYPPFAANGIDFNHDQSVLYVANTGEDTVIKVPVMADGRAGTPVVLTHSVNSPDGLIVDEQDNILVASNHGNHIMVLDPTGTAIAVYGDFDGISKKGIVKGLLSPSDLVKIGDDIFVTNFALDVSTFGLPTHATSAYTQQVKRYSIARISPDEEDEHEDRH